MKTDLHYMSFEEAITQAFTDEHQASLRNRRRDNNVVGEVTIGARESRSIESDQNKITQGKNIRGVVTCKECMKPRCLLYSITATNRMKPNPADGVEEPTKEAILLCRTYAIEQFESAETNAIFVCGMQPFDADDLMHGVIVTREGLECHHPVEFEYYANPKATPSWFDGALSAYCAGSSGAKGFVNDHLSIEWKSVLPVCQDCRADGARPLARSKRRNGAVNGKRAERDRVTADVPEANVDDVTPMAATGMPPATTSTAPRTTKR
jgi:hypothetical protein